MGLALQVQGEVATRLWIRQAQHDLLAAEVVPLLDWLLEQVFQHRGIDFVTAACSTTADLGFTLVEPHRVRVDPVFQSGLLQRLDCVMLDAELFIELRIVGFGQVEVGLLERDLQLRVVPRLALVESPRRHQIQLFFIMSVREIAAIAQLALE